jgi:uncharacterized RDD family membrane protein YckC
LQAVQKAHSHRILGCVIYDTLIVMGLLMITSSIAVGFHKLLSGQDTLEHSRLFQAYLLLVIALYFIYFWKRAGQTVGMKAWRVKLVNIADQPLSYRQLIIRWLVAIPAYACLLVGVFWQYWSHDGLNWHDKASNTRLVFTPKPNK